MIVDIIHQNIGSIYIYNIYHLDRNLFQVSTINKRKIQFLLILFIFILKKSKV